MISTINGNNATQARATGGAPCRSGARLLLQTAATLSLAGYCPATATGRGRRRKAVPLKARASLPCALDRRQRGQQARHGERRESAVPPAADDKRPGRQPLAFRAKKKGHKKDAGWQLRPAGGRTGSTPATGSRRPAGVAAPDEPARAPDPQRRSDKRTACTRETAIPLYQHNFTRIKEDLGGCYRLAEEVTLQGDEAQALPIGNLSHPFTGSFNDDGHRLTVNLTRPQGDAVVFGSIDHSRINLTLDNSHLETANGGRAALIGTMKADNQVVIRRLMDSAFKATGEGTVEAALVARTTESGNRLVIEEALSNQLSAQALPGAGTSTAMVSLGLGRIEAAGAQSISQQKIWSTRLQAIVSEASAGGESEPAHPGTGAFGALLGFLDARITAQQDLSSRQDTITGNLVETVVEGRQGSGRSCASLGYASVDCGRATPAQSWTGRLQVAQVHVVHSVARARVDWQADGPGDAERRPQGGLARATLVSTEPVSRLDLVHHGIASVLLQAEAGVIQRALLPPTRKAHVLLLEGGDSTVPLFGHWGGPHNCSIVNGPVAGDRQPGTSLVDSAGYRLASFNCDSQAATKAFIADTRQPEDWRWALALFTDFERRFAGLAPVPGGLDNSLHYPGERLQSLITGSGADGQWLLVTRQYHLWHRENPSGRLLRVTRYGPPPATRFPAGQRPDSREALPQTLPPSRPGFTLHSPEAGDPPLQDTRPVHSLVHQGQLIQLYQQQGQPAQLVILPVWRNGPYRLLQYEALPGQARLLSVEGQGELHLWMQQGESNILQVYRLGAQTRAGCSGTCLHWRFDLSDQPGGKALLARDGDWFYSLRQPRDQVFSLRRFAIDSGKMDTAWQPDRNGWLSDDLSLVVDRGRLMTVYPGWVPDPHAQEPCSLLVAMVPRWGGGPLAWVNQSAPVCQELPTEPGPGARLADVSPEPASTPPAAAAEEEQKTFFGSAGAALGTAAVPALVTLGACCASVLSLWLCQRRQRQRAPGAGAVPEGRGARAEAMDGQALRLGRRI